MEFADVTEVVINSTEVLRRTSEEDIRRRSTRLLGAEPVTVDLHKLTVDLLQILLRKGSIYNKFSMQNGYENTRYTGSICPGAGNSNLRYRTLVELKEVKNTKLQKSVG